MNLPLHKLATIRSGYQFRGRVEPHPDGNVAVIQIKDLIDDQILHPDRLTRVKLDKSIESYEVQAGDVLFLSRGHRLAATVIEQPLHSTIAPGYFFVIRPDPTRVLPGYLAWYINQSRTQNRLRPSHAGSHMPIVPMSAFRKIDIDVPPLATQQAIVALTELARREQRLLDELQQAQHQLIEKTCLLAISQPAEKGKPQ